jgi:hypothetical protein
MNFLRASVFRPFQRSARGTVAQGRARPVQRAIDVEVGQDTAERMIIFTDARRQELRYRCRGHRAVRRGCPR